jgi:polyisoprenoid-binding protein YceI
MNKKKWILLIVVVVLLGIIGTWFFVFFYPTHYRRDVSSEKATTITAQSLVQEFISGEDSANKKYINKAIEVSGDVDHVAADTSGTTVFLKTNIADAFVSCRLKDKPTTVPTGNIKVKGILTGYILGEVQLNEAIITSASNSTSVTPIPATVDTSKPVTTAPVIVAKKDTTPATKAYRIDKGQISFFSSTPAEDIEANNTQVLGTIIDKTGELTIAALIKGFRFENELMQEHFNKKEYMNSDEFPKATFKGNITNLDVVHWDKDGSYDVTVNGTLTIHGSSQKTKATGTLIIKSGKPSIKSVFYIKPKDYGINTSDIAENVKITIAASYN